MGGAAGEDDAAGPAVARPARGEPGDGGGGPLASGPQLGVFIAQNFTAGGAATLRVQLEAAVDTNNTGTPGTWDIIDQSDDIPVALLAQSSPARPLVSFEGPPRLTL